MAPLSSPVSPGPADIKAVVDAALRAAICRSPESVAPCLLMDDLVSVLTTHRRAIRPETAWASPRDQSAGPRGHSAKVAAVS